MQEMRVWSLDWEDPLENGDPFQFSCLGNPTDKGAWQTTVQGIARVGHNLVTKQQQQLDES